MISTKTPLTVTCPHCQQSWPFDYNYCPADGRSLRGIKKRILRNIPERPILPIVDDTYLPMFRRDIRRDAHASLAEYADRITLEDLAAAFVPEIRRARTQDMIRYYGFDGGGRRTQSAIGGERSVSNIAVGNGISQLRQSKTIWRLLRQKARADR